MHAEFGRCGSAKAGWDHYFGDDLGRLTWQFLGCNRRGFLLYMASCVSTASDNFSSSSGVAKVANYGGNFNLGRSRVSGVKRQGTVEGGNKKRRLG